MHLQAQAALDALREGAACSDGNERRGSYRGARDAAAPDADELKALVAEIRAQPVLIPDLEPLEEAVARFEAWRERARELMAGRPTLAELQDACEEAAALQVGALLGIANPSCPPIYPALVLSGSSLFH